jgi:5-hydroxyisourate hydrolase
MISTHVLDTSIGRPAATVRVRLECEDAGEWRLLADAETDHDGRVRELLPDDATLRTGKHRITFAVGAWFGARGVRAFFPVITVQFDVTDPLAHHHVPLLVSPFGYSTYRGS